MATKLEIAGPLSLAGVQLAIGQSVRRRALHDEYGGNPMGGISTLGTHAGIFAFTGLSGESHGYHDEWLPDGTFRYYGEGQVGDMELKAGNRAIDDQVADGARLFLFDMNSGVRAHVVYKGEFRKARRGEDRGPDRNGDDRRRYYFDLAPIGADSTQDSAADTQTVFDEGREREIKTNRVERRRAYVDAAKKIHGLTCQVCGVNFGQAYGPHGEGFIEVHHLLPVAEAAKAGKTKINARTELAVLCSNCHRMIHRGQRLLTLDELRHIVTTVRPDTLVP